MTYILYIVFGKKRYKKNEEKKFPSSGEPNMIKTKQEKNGKNKEKTIFPYTIQKSSPESN